MIKSMTGYGKANGEVQGINTTLEIKSLNSKFLELFIRLMAFRDKETELRNMLTKEIERGKVEVNLAIDNQEEKRKSFLNKEVIAGYYKDLLALKPDLNLSTPDYLKIIMGLPNVMNVDKGETGEKGWLQLEELVKKAIRAFNEFRIMEGKVLAADFTMRLNLIDACLTKIEKLEPARMKALKGRLKKGIEGIADISIDKNRFEQELIYYLEKIDITEEKVRLKSHLRYFSETMKAKDSNGKKLGFITQEIGREINTIGSKANDAGIQKLVVEMKDELEKIKEQTANVL